MKIMINLSHTAMNCILPIFQEGMNFINLMCFYKLGRSDLVIVSILETNSK